MKVYNRIYDILSPVTKRAREYSLALAERYADVFEIASADTDELTEALFGDASSALLLKLAASLNARRVTDSFKFGQRHTREEICEYFQHLFLPLSVETVYIMCLDKDDRVISCDLVGEGTVNQSSVFSRRLTEIAMRHSAKQAIVAHNHPRGAADFSKEDKLATSSLSALLSGVGILLRAHYLIAGDECHEMSIVE